MAAVALEPEPLSSEIVGAVLAEIQWAQARLLDPADYPQGARAAGRRPPLSVDEIAGAYGRYNEAKRINGLIDLNDLLTGCAELLEQDTALAAAARWRIRHLFVDEFQDVNPAQWRLLQAWLGGRTDLFVVGDPRQAVYGWNGADPSLPGPPARAPPRHRGPAARRQPPVDPPGHRRRPGCPRPRR